VRYEDTKWRVSSLEWEDRPHGELDFEAPAVINPTARGVRVRHRVDRHAEPPPALEEPHLVVLYRASRTLRRRRSRRSAGGTNPPSARPFVENASAFPPHVRTEFGSVALGGPSVRGSPQCPGSAKVRAYVLNDIGGRLFSAWSKDQSCADGVREVLAELGREPDARFLDRMAGVLADLVEQGIVLGSPR